jgi:hypothetical protein
LERLEVRREVGIGLDSMVLNGSGRDMAYSGLQRSRQCGCCCCCEHGSEDGEFHGCE